MLGREGELHDLCELLVTHGERLVTVTGRGGSGKTSLALVAGATMLVEHPGGVWVVPLATAAVDEGVLDAIAAAVGAEGDLETTSLQAITARLAERGPALLILDNVEHLVPAVAGELTALLDALPQLRVLATSQVPVRISPERVLTLDAFDDNAALALIERVQADLARRSWLG